MEEQWKTQKTLLMRAQDQDNQAAWTEFTEYYKGFIHAVLHQMRIYPSDIDDLTQEALISIWKSLPGYAYDKNRARFRTWLSQLIYYIVSNYIRTNVRRNNKHKKAEKENDGGDNMTLCMNEVSDIIHKEWQEHVIKLALKKVAPLFSKGAMEAFSMSIKGESTAAIAEKLNIKPNSVIKLKNRVTDCVTKEINHIRAQLEVL